MRENAKSGRFGGARDLAEPLAERLAAEQINAGLIHALVRKAELEGQRGRLREVLERFLQQELRHTLLLERAIRGFGGNPALATPGTRRLNASAAVLQRIVLDSGTSLSDSLDAMLVAELCDRIGWEELVNLAERRGFGTLAWEFRGALLEEREQERVFCHWRDDFGGGEELLRRTA